MATTIMVVSFVNAGLLELGQAIGVIMGANIGTTITAWIMAVFGFSFNMADFAYPLLLLGYVLLQMKKNQKILSSFAFSTKNTIFVPSLKPLCNNGTE